MARCLPGCVGLWGITLLSLGFNLIVLDRPILNILLSIYEVPYRDSRLHFFLGLFLFAPIVVLSPRLCFRLPQWPQSHERRFARF